MIVVRKEWADGLASRKCWAERVRAKRRSHSQLDTAQQARLAGIKRQSWLSAAFGVPSQPSRELATYVSSDPLVGGMSSLCVHRCSVLTFGDIPLIRLPHHLIEKRLYWSCW